MTTLISGTFFFFAFLPLSTVKIERRKLRRLTLRNQHEMSAGAIKADNIYTFHGEREIENTKRHFAANLTERQNIRHGCVCLKIVHFCMLRSNCFLIYTKEFQG